MTEKYSSIRNKKYLAKKRFDGSNQRLLTKDEKMTMTKVAIAHGDGIGPEIMKATLDVLHAATDELEYFPIEVGEKVYLQGELSGISQKSWDVLRDCKVFLKAPITTPQGGGYKSLNVTIRVAMGLYANVRPCLAYAPYIKTKHPGMDVVIVRENEEDLYAGIEYRPNDKTFYAMKVNTEMGCEKIIRYAFEYAKSNNRKKVSCFAKDNILKLTDGLFVKTFFKIAKEYPEIAHDTWNVDIGAAKLADVPTMFEVIVMPNLYGDILSDVAAQIAGSVGLAGSANIGKNRAMFEAIHGSAPKRAGQNLANPSGLLHAAIMMLSHVNKPHIAELISNAWLKTIEDGICTYDIFEEGKSIHKVGTNEFARAICDRLGKKPSILKQAHFGLHGAYNPSKETNKSKEQKTLVGCDVYVAGEFKVEELYKRLFDTVGKMLTIQFISNRGATFWPIRHIETDPSDLWRVRFLSEKTVQQKDIAQLHKMLIEKDFDVTSTVNLYMYDDRPGFSQIQQ